MRPGTFGKLFQRDLEARSGHEKSNLRMLLAQCTAKTSNIVCLVQPAGRPVRGTIFELSGRLAASLEEINGGSRVEVQAILDDVTSSTGLESLEPLAERYAGSFDDVIVLGTGGSSLGGRTLCSLASVSTVSGARRPTNTASAPFYG